MSTKTITKITLEDWQVRYALEHGRVELWVAMEKQPPDDASEVFSWFIPPERRDKGATWAQEGCYVWSPRGLSFIEESPFGPPGTEHWVAEEWCEYEIDDVQGTRLFYRADKEVVVFGQIRLAWNPAETMPLEHSRLTLRTLSSEPRQVQTVTEEEAIATGVLRDAPVTHGDWLLRGSLAIDRFAKHIDGWHGGTNWHDNAWFWRANMEVVR